jgi:hypothetical protein
MSSIPVDFHLSKPMTTQLDWGSIFESHRRWLATIVRARLAAARFSRSAFTLVTSFDIT